MAYKQSSCTPVTAKVQKTTKGGMVQQPLLNMGAPVKMKMTSPAKQGSQANIDARKEANKKRAEAEKPKDNRSRIERLKLEIGSMTNTLENYKKQGGKVVASDANYLQKAKEELSSLLKPSKYSEATGTGMGMGKERADKNKAAKNNTKKDIAIEKVAGGYFGNTLKEEKTKDSNRIDFPMETKKPITKTPKKDSIKRKKVETIKPNIEAKTVSMETKSEIILPNKPVEVKGIEEAKKKIDVAENKESRAAKVRAKGEKALAEGNKDKALRLKRREERILKRAQKKRSQASEAIEPN